MRVLAGRPTTVARWGAAMTAIVLLVAGCTNNAAKEDSAGRQNSQIEVLRALPFGDGAQDVVTDVLERAGVGVYDDDAEVTDGKPVRVTRWQVRNLAIEAANGGGLPGNVLAELAPVPQGVPPVPYLVAAWIDTYGSQGAKFAKELMGAQDWTRADQILFPDLVLTLFLADAVADVPYSPPTVTRSASGEGGQGGPCSFAANFIQNSIATVATLLKVNTSGGGFFGFLGVIWNAAVTFAAAAIKGLIDTVTKPVVDLIADAFGLVAMIQQLSSIVTKWRAELRADPSHTRFGVDSEVVTGQFQLTVTQSQVQIPDFVADCAAAFGVDLRNAGSAAGSKVTWRENNTGRADLSARLSADDKLAQNKTAQYRYQTGQESSELAKSPDTASPSLFVSARVQRNDVDKIEEMLAKVLLDQIPNADARAIVKDLAQPVIDGAKAKLATITDVSARSRAYITYHIAAKPSATPSIPDTGTPGKLKIPVGCPTAVLTSFGYTSTGSETFDGVLACWYLRGAQLGVAITSKKGTASNCPHAKPIDIPGAEAAWIDNGKSGDSKCSNAPTIDVVVSNGALSVSGGNRGTDEVIAIAKRILGVS